MIFLEALLSEVRNFGLQNPLILWEGRSSSIETDYNIKEEGKDMSGYGQEKGHEGVNVCSVLCFCDQGRDKEVRE